MPGIIDVSQLVKTYGDGTKAVKGITFSVNEGEFFGFLGPNGAGKSTTIKILTTLVHNPKILFLDEPTTGLDPQSRAAIWAYLKKLNEQGITIFITTQYLEEVDRLCRRLAIVDLGEIVAQGTPGELKQEIGADSISLGFENSSMNGGDTKTKARQVLEQKFDGVSNVVDSDVGLTVYAKNGSYMVPELVRAFDEANIRLSTIGVSSPTLDDVFLKHTGKRIRVEEVSSANSRGMFGRRRR